MSTKQLRKGSPGQSTSQSCGDKRSMRTPTTCEDCGKTFSGAPNSKRCPTCAKNRHRQQTREAQRIAYERGKEHICEDCGKTFWWKGTKKYCPDCSTPEKKARRHSDQQRARAKAVRAAEAEAQRDKKRREKYKKLIADLVSGARPPKNNHEAIIRIEALGRIHGGSHGSYGKEAAGYYAERK